ncbi:MAG: CDF family Co(II)/Ni(II) efflux transporter DmeF [Proteobacteria bacterium]|nr:CDF family Co(II)/Ni(II) efflux transporter DmeF [Pseudomonadota bacterium]
MHTHNLSHWQHEHVFDAGSHNAERSTRLVMWITLATMVVEICAGWWFNSMALLADGWHMSSHALALGLAALAYGAARRYARDPRFAFGTWKIEVLGGFASAIVLLGVSALMVFGSLERLFAPQSIAYREAIAVAVLGLVINVACAFILGHAHHGHAHDHDHGHEHGHHHDHHHPHGGGEDLNLKSAYLHVIADAATSLLAIVALVGGWLYGWQWLDPVMGVVGAVLVAVWAKGLLAQTGKVLLDREMDHPVVDEIREVVEQDADPHDETRIADLHVWRVGKAAYSCAVTVVTHSPTLTAEDIRRRLAVHEEIVHSTIEIHRCPA